jgi:DNA polymerase II large subunit
MSDKPKCNACGLEIHNDSDIAYMGISVRHKHRSHCVQPLKDRIAELERQLAEARSSLHASASLNADLDRQLAEAREDTARLDWLHDRLMVSHYSIGDQIGLSQGWVSLREAIDAARKERG